MNKFIELLECEGELRRVVVEVDPVLEIAEITDRVVKAGGPALLFENTGTGFPVLTNMLGSERRLELALGGLGDVSRKISGMASTAMSGNKLKMVPLLGRVARWLPRRVRGRGACQQVRLESLDALPILKSWPHDGGRFVTLPLVHTADPHTGARNVGMYRMQVTDGLTTGMHWHVHKTGERHYRAWQADANSSSRMPVTVCLGGDPVYTYCATAPLPDGVDEYLLAGFLRGRAVRTVKCLTNNLWVPEDCDFVIEGYVDTAEPKFMEGPFGDHTGFYSLEDLYPRFHVTAITHRRGAVWPATVVGVPPQEDYFIALATERIFLEPLRLMHPEIVDLHMPAAGVAHNLALISIDASYPGQALKVAAAMWGAGQMMFNKVLLVLPSDVGLHDTAEIARRVRSADLSRDVLFGRGVADALDHAATTPGIGGKIALDLTSTDSVQPTSGNALSLADWGVMMVFDGKVPDDTAEAKYIVLADEAARELTPRELLWHVAANVDPERDIALRGGRLLIDGRTKAGRGAGYPSRTPNVVVSSPETIALVDTRWAEYGLGDLIPSPSQRYQGLVYSDKAKVE
jgi:4-hydroxy-3-polyprenylbenzoate decarboxylase